MTEGQEPQELELERAGEGEEEGEMKEKIRGVPARIGQESPPQPKPRLQSDATPRTWEVQVE